jgi:tetratricopeptide (TPR) repeat protein
VRGEQSAEVLDLRMSCLSERLDRMRALGDVLAAATPTVVENAVAAGSALPGLDRCADTRLLRAVLPPPDDAAARARVEAARRDLAHVKALGDSGQCAAGAAAASKLVDQAFTVGYLPLKAEALNALAQFGAECSDPGRAVRQYKEAFWAAEASRHDEAAAEALIRMSELLADRLHDVGAAQDWIRGAGAVLGRMGGGHPALEAAQLAALGIVTSRDGQPDEGLAYLKQSLALKEKAFGAEHVEVVRALAAIGMVLQQMGRFDDSVRYYAQAREMATRLVGAEHPLYAWTTANASEALNATGRYAEARHDLEHALRVWRASGSAPFYLAYADTNLGEALLGLGEPRAAEEVLAEALRLTGESPSASSPIARFALARALWAEPEARPRALDLARRARDEYRQGGAPPWRLAALDSWLATRATSPGSSPGANR